MPLSDLAAALAAATGPSRELDERLAVEVFGWRLVNPHQNGWKHPTEPVVFMQHSFNYTSSLDAITGAVKARWPGARVFSGNYDAFAEEASPPTAEIDLGAGVYVRAGAATEALARCLAAARLAEREAGER